MQTIIMDSDSKSLSEQFALIKTPRKNRMRYSEACVTIVDTEQQAHNQAQPEHEIFPAVVYGPSKSSENVCIYYLIKWLDE